MSKLMSEGKVVQAVCTSDAVDVGFTIFLKKPPMMHHGKGEYWHGGLRLTHLPEVPQSHVLQLNAQRVPSGRYA